MSGILYDVGRWCFRRRGQVLVAWLLVLLLVGGLAGLFAKSMSDSFAIPGAPSQEAYNQLRMTFPEAADAGATAIITVPEGASVRDPQLRREIEGWLATVGQQPYVAGTVSPYHEYVHGRISAAGRSALISIRLVGMASEFSDANKEALQRLTGTLTPQLPPGSRVLMGGDVFAIQIPHLSLVEALGAVVALVVLVATLGSVLVGAVPLLNSLVGVGLAMAVTYGATRFTQISSTTPMLGLMLGLAVGIDYALFIISRHRDQLGAHPELSAEESAARSVATAGSAVVFAGLTVIIALVGLVTARIPFLTVMGAFAAVAVAIGVAVALTLLPAILGLLGDRVRPRRRRDVPAARARTGGWSGWWVRLVTRVPLLTVVLVVAGLGALSLPAKDLWLSLPNAGQLPAGTPARLTYDAVAEEFGPGYNGPLVVTMQVVESTDPLGILNGIKADLEQIPGVASVPVAVPNPNADTGMIQVIPTTGPDDPRTEDLVTAIGQRVPQWRDRYRVEVAVTGMTAVGLDITQRLADALLPFGIFVVGLSLVLLTMVFRSLAVPIKAAVGYLLSIGSAFGATTLVFNRGWFAWAINLHQTTAVISFFPILTMGILFGLAMDYEVFLVARIREEHVHGADARQAVRDGFGHSAKVVVAAAAIMFAVFAFFVPQGEGALKPIAFGLAVGVAVDAFLIRMTLVPAVLHLLAEKAWWLPRWLDRVLPSFDVEGETLARQLELADWPAPGDRHRVVADDVGVGQRPVLVSPVSLRLAAGQVLVVTGSPLARAALLLTLGGRMAPASGRLKVLGYLAPDQNGKIRRRVACQDPFTPDLARRLRSREHRLVLVDDADTLYGAKRAALADLVREPGEAAVVLGASTADGVRDLIRPGDLVLSLDATPALTDAQGGTR